MDRLNIIELLGQTHKCCKILRKAVARGERLIKLSYSWFSTKPILVGTTFI